MAATDDGFDTQVIRAAVSSRLFGRDDIVRVGRYEVRRRLGDGGMGVVYAAHDAELDREIAVKLLRTDAWSDATARDRMRREAQAMARLNHPNVATVHEVGEHEGMPYVAMELIDGPTLRVWVLEQTRSWQDILAVYGAAGRGLAAAHGVGLVHRDFKPDNAMLGSDGRVRVTDFGLARGSARAPEATAADLDASPGTRPITHSSAIGGTPAYMAPEQFAGDAGDARVDQFAFCVSVWEALVGRRPFGGDRVIALIEAVTRGDLPSTSAWPDRVPRWIRAVLARGLRVDPAQRWPDMPALLAALADDPAKRRRRRWLMGGVAIAGIATIVGFRARHDRAVAACDDAAAAIDATWNDERAAAIRASVVDTGAINAGDAFDRARPWLDEFAEQWRTVRRDQCMATTVEHTRDAALAQDSAQCLEQRAGMLAALVDVWSEPDAGLVWRLVASASGLPTPARCADDAYVVRRVKPPDDPELAAAVTAMHARINRNRALEAAGRTAVALAEANATLADARALDWPPMLADALTDAGRIADRTGAADKAEPLLREAFAVAHGAGADETAVAAATALTYSLAGAGKVDEALQWSELARAAVLRTAESEDPAGASVELTAGFAHHQHGDFARAIEHYDRALQIRVAAFGEHHPSVAIVYQHIGKAEYAREAAEASRAAFERTLEINRACLGEDHPAVANALEGLGVLLVEQGVFDEAEALLETSRTIRERVFGAKSPPVSQSLANLGNVSLGRNDLDRALERYRAAYEMMLEIHGADHPDLVVVLCNIAMVQGQLGLRSEATSSYREALRIQEQVFHAEHPETARLLVLLGGELVRSGDATAAMPMIERARAINEAAFGPDHTRTIDVLQLLGEALVELGRPSEAIAPLERALAAGDTSPGEPNDGGYSRFSLARALWNSGGDRARAVKLAEQAEAIFADDEDDAATRVAIREWLASHSL
jgi:tetratricopeptide (TPR) repeat protein/tRNA A-37 threonylcarbamoyl transferase component Bud32